jgi:hypothetical protein
MQLQDPRIDISAGDDPQRFPRYTATAPDGRRFERLDLPALARLLHREGLGRGWQIATT